MPAIDTAIQAPNDRNHDSMPTKPGTALVVARYDYSGLDSPIVEQVQMSADKIRTKVKKALEDVIEIGRDLIKVKDLLPHGQFGPWIRGELGWPERTVRNHGVAEAGANRHDCRFGDPADCRLPSPRHRCRRGPHHGDRRAESGEKVTMSVIKNWSLGPDGRAATSPDTRRPSSSGCGGRRSLPGTVGWDDLPRWSEICERADD